jgi:hypothetical protein
MICLIEHESTGYDGFFKRIRRRLTGDNGYRCEKRMVFGMPVLHVTLAFYPRAKETFVRKTIGASAAQLRKGSRVLFSKDFPYRAAFLREGFEEAEGTILTELLSGQLASFICPEGKTALMISKKLSGRAVQALWSLCLRFRHVLCVTESDGRALYGAISKKQGVSVISAPSPRQLLEADVAVVFNPPPEHMLLSDTCVVLPVGSTVPKNIYCRRFASEISFGIKDAESMEYAELTERFPLNALIAAALEAGVLRVDDVLVRSVHIQEKPAVIRYG